MVQITPTVLFDETKPLDKQSEEFQEYAQAIFATIDFTNMSNLVGNECSWQVDDSGLRFIAKRVYINPKMYTVKEHLFNVEKV